MEWPWPTIIQAALSVRAYHTDLANTLIGGKSPAIARAYKWGTKLERQRLLAKEHEAKGTDPVLAAIRAQDEVKVEAIHQLGFGVKVVSKEDAAPDLMAMFKELKAKPS